MNPKSFYQYRFILKNPYIKKVQYKLILYHSDLKFISEILYCIEY